jgi:RNA polymerase sigma-70 factor (ECF subfamily)
MNTDDSGIRDTEKAIGTYGRLVYGIALAQLKRKSDAEDVFQEVFLLYHRSGKEFADDEHRKAWLIRTAVNFCRKYNFSSWQLKTVPLDEEDSDVFVCETQEETRVWNELCELKPKYKIPIYLYYFEDMPIEKIALSMGLKNETVRKRLSRGRQILKQRLECDYFE